MNIFFRAVDSIQQAAELDWEGLYRELIPHIYNYFRYRVGDASSAEDLTAITFEKAWGKRHTYSDRRGAFSTWLFTIARNVATDHFRKRRSELPLETALGRSSAMALDDLIQRRLDFARLRGLLAGLPPREQDILSLKYGADLSHKQIAQVMGLSESNVGTIAHRAIQRLQHEWGPAHE
ncbi:MAG TPA: RNA polymerase sigma factor [Herpetosiphonaceae bacterium]